jgi:hypothetical protein
MFQRSPRGTVPHAVADAAFTAWNGAKRLEVPHELLEYFKHPVHFDTTQTIRALDGTGIVCPDLQDYLPEIVHYFMAHKKP